MHLTADTESGDYTGNPTEDNQAITTNNIVGTVRNLTTRRPLNNTNGISNTHSKITKVRYAPKGAADRF